MTRASSSRKKGSRPTDTGKPTHLSVCDLEWQRLKAPPQPTIETKKTIRVADLFSGCGGLSLGAREAITASGRHCKIVLAIDTERDALSVYKKNLQVSQAVALEAPVERYFDSALGAEMSTAEVEIRSKLRRVDLLLAGPPCQGHSDLNNRTRRADPRNQLYLKTIRAAEILRPSCMLIENVATVIHDKSGVIATALGHLQSLGYSVRQLTIRADLLGLPQRRVRHVLIATRSATEDALQNMQLPAQKKASLKAAIYDIIDLPATSHTMFDTPPRTQEENRARIKYLFANNLYELPDAMRPPCHRDKKHSYKSVYGRLHWDKPAQTLTSGFGSMGQGRYVHPSRARLITPHEAARIQGFPDFFDFSSVTSRFGLQQIIANAVPPRLAACVVSSLIQHALL